MSFANDLLDGFEVLYKRTDGVLDTCKDISSFYKELGKIEKDYGRALIKLAGSQKRFFEKASIATKEYGSTDSAWGKVLGEIERAGQHHEQTADKLQNEVSKSIENYIKEKQKTKKKLYEDGHFLTKEWKTAKETLDKARGKYVSLSKDAEQAEQQHNKGKADREMKPTQLAKLAAKASQAQDKANQSDQEYQTVLDQTNKKQTDFYTNTMPKLLSEFQQFEEERVKFMKEMGEKFASLNSEKPVFYQKSCEVIGAAFSDIAVESDIDSFVSANKTNVSVPNDIPYFSWDQDPSTGATGTKLAKGKTSVNLKFNPGKSHADVLISKDWGLTSSDSSLSEDQKYDKLKGQLDELEKCITSETKSKEGLENLVRFYGSDPVAQKKAEDELIDLESKLEKLRALRDKVSGQMGDHGGGSSSSGGSKCRGLYDYTATCDTELTFSAGEILTVTEQDESGWWYCETSDGRAGFVPNNYVELME